MLYHYTDFFAFDGIIGNRELRLNNVLNMNDTQEMRFYMEGICIAFDSDLLKKLTDTTHGAVSMHRVHYGQDFANMLIETLWRLLQGVFCAKAWQVKHFFVANAVNTIYTQNEHRS